MYCLYLYNLIKLLSSSAVTCGRVLTLSLQEAILLAPGLITIGVKDTPNLNDVQPFDTVGCNRN